MQGLKDVDVDTKGVPLRTAGGGGARGGGNTDSSGNVGTSSAAWGALREAAAVVSGHVDRLSGSWPIDDADR